MQERKIETTPSELMQALGGAALEATKEEDMEVVRGALQLITLVGLKAIRHLTGVYYIDQEALERFETDSEDIEQYLQDQEKLVEKLEGYKS